MSTDGATPGTAASPNTEVLAPQTEPPVPPSPAFSPPAPPEGDRRRRRWPLFAALAFLLVAAAAVAVALVSGGPGTKPDPAAAFTRKLGVTMRPVATANQALSARLVAIDGRHPQAARIAADEARAATLAAQGALGATDVPQGSRQLATEARQALSRETAYLSAVGAVLADPQSTSAGEVQTLATTLTDALAAAGAKPESVDGAQPLTAWAQNRARAIQAAAASRRQAHVDQQNLAAQEAAQQAQEAARRAENAAALNNTNSGPRPSGSTACGDGVYVGPNTSCALGRNLRDEWRSLPGVAIDVTAFSPTSNQAYTLACDTDPIGIRCDGEGNAGPITVWWRQ
jgi:hypothetical protein